MSFESQDADTFAGEDERKRDSSKKRDGKKEKKEKGYQMFEEEDSEEERLVLAEEIRSPSKKKDKIIPSFKFQVRKEKTKEKEEKKEKESKEEKEKKKEEKKKNKVKDKKKLKAGHHDTGTVIVEPALNENPIFGVPLATAVERNKSHDGIELPAIVRECIDYIEECGLACEGIYRISGVKSKVQHLKDCYNRQQPVHLFEHEPNIVASLLKQFLRDLPEPVLTTALMPKFEEASTYKSNKKKVEGFSKLINDLPTCNRLLLSWMIVHMTHVIELHKENKMTLQNVSIVLSPTMQISHRVLNVLFSNVNELFGDVLLRKYIPPLKPAHSKWSLELPDNPSALEEELAKQESLLNQLHAEVNSGRDDPDTVDQLWEVQRVVTQLKRKIKTAKKNVEMGERRRANPDAKRSSTASIPSLSAPEDLQLSLRPAPDPKVASTTTVAAVVEKQPDDEHQVQVEAALEPKKGVTFAESSKKTKAPQIGEIKKMEEEKKVKEEVKTEVEKVQEGKEPQEQKASEQGAGETAEKLENDKEKHIKKEELASAQTSPNKITESEKQVPSSDVKQEIKEPAKEKDLKENVLPQENKTQAVEEQKAIDKAEVTEKKIEPIEKQAAVVENKEQEVVKKAEKKDVPISTTPHEVISQVKGRFEVTTKTEDVPEKVAEPAKPSEPDKSAEPAKPAEPSKPAEPAKLAEPAKPAEPKAPAATAQIHAAEPKPQREENKPKPAAKVEYVYRKPPNPPFMSTDLLKPMKAEIPKPKPPVEDTEAKKEHMRKSEELRELEEELLGEKKKKKEDFDLPENVDIEQLLEEEYALELEKEELLAIADELKQKIATERSEMERLTQEIQELQYLRQDSDLEDLSTSSSSSDESEDEDDLQDLLSQLLNDNENLEMKNADLCQKIHEERMICLSVKLQIRLLQQKHLETSYG
ncbi:ralA-binding protein 1-like [Physella acuta]|uniref:ralA-binding protein 1-like n=1 Tax=Physella acuta TaxID=109671 RepID=UPI0027DE6035|nr:ralA-binding protein 1-like [Physella acuta]XP_059179464.1 ralA-binding protein 1-like [Physella acuta]